MADTASSAQTLCPHLSVFMNLEHLGLTPTCLFQEVVTEGAYGDLAVTDVGIKIPWEQYRHWHHPGLDGTERRKTKESNRTLLKPLFHPLIV